MKLCDIDGEGHEHFNEFFEILAGRVEFFQGHRILVFFQENIKYRKLLRVKLIFRCKCPKSTQPYFGTFPVGSATASGGRTGRTFPTPVTFYPGFSFSVPIVIYFP